MLYRTWPPVGTNCIDSATTRKRGVGRNADRLVLFTSALLVSGVSSFVRMEGSVSVNPYHLVRELKEFTERCRSRVTELLQELGWEQEVPGGEQVCTSRRISAGSTSTPDLQLQRHRGAVVRIAKQQYRP